MNMIGPFKTNKITFTYLIAVDVFEDAGDLVIAVQLVLLVEWLRDPDPWQVLHAVLHEHFEHVARSACNYDAMGSNREREGNVQVSQ